MTDIFRCNSPGLDERIAGDIWQRVLSSHGVSLNNPDSATLERIYRTFVKDFCFVAFDTPNFASIKEVAHYANINNSTAGRYYQEFLQWKRQQR